VNQNHRGRVFIARFLVMNAKPINVREARVFRMKNNVTTLPPIGISRPQQQLPRDGQCCCSSYPIPLLHFEATDYTDNTDQNQSVLSV
jgi:hypothetical protein